MLGGVRDAMVSYRQLETKENEEVFLKRLLSSITTARV